MAAPRKVKYPQPTPEDAWDAKKRTEYTKNDYQVLMGFGEGLSEVKYKRVAEDLKQWIESHPEAKNLRAFRRARDIKKTKWEHWVAASPELRESVDHALECIADNREEMLCKHIYPEKSFLFMQPRYDKEWKIREQEMALLKEAQEQKKTTFNITIPAIPTIEDKK